MANRASLRSYDAGRVHGVDRPFCPCDRAASHRLSDNKDSLRTVPKETVATAAGLIVLHPPASLRRPMIYSAPRFIPLLGRACLAPRGPAP